jgi:flagellar biogenesis protein FliO
LSVLVELALAWLIQAAPPVAETPAAPAPAPLPGYDERALRVDDSAAGVPAGRPRPGLAPPDMFWGVFWAVAVVLMLGAVLWLLRRFLRHSRFVVGGGAVAVLARAALDAQARLYLVEVGNTLFLIGGGRDGLTALGTIRDPQEVAALRARAGGPRAQPAFEAALTEELRAGERTQGWQKMRDQIDRIRSTLRRWGNGEA